jgi:hypothetical protein
MRNAQKPSCSSPYVEAHTFVEPRKARRLRQAQPRGTEAKNAG